MKKKNRFSYFFQKQKKDPKIRKNAFFQQIRDGKIIFKQNIDPNIFPKPSMHMDTRSHTSKYTNEKALFYVNSRIKLW